MAHRGSLHALTSAHGAQLRARSARGIAGGTRDQIRQSLALDIPQSAF
jgi:hypothetical protein